MRDMQKTLALPMACPPDTTGRACTSFHGFTWFNLNSQPHFLRSLA